MNGSPIMTTELRILRENYPHKGASGCVPLLPGRSENAIRLMAWKHGIKRDTDALRQSRVSRLIPGALHVCYGGQP